MVTVVHKMKFQIPHWILTGKHLNLRICTCFFVELRQKGPTLSIKYSFLCITEDPSGELNETCLVSLSDSPKLYRNVGALYA